MICGLCPKYAVLDPELTLGLPPDVTAMTGMDALCHAVEAYTNDKYNSDTERELCRKAVRLIYENLLKVYENGSDIEARQKMQQAAFYADGHLQEEESDMFMRSAMQSADCMERLMDWQWRFFFLM